VWEGAMSSPTVRPWLEFPDRWFMGIWKIKNRGKVWFPSWEGWRGVFCVMLVRYCMMTNTPLPPTQSGAPPLKRAITYKSTLNAKRGNKYFNKWKVQLFRNKKSYRIYIGCYSIVTVGISDWGWSRRNRKVIAAAS